MITTNNLLFDLARSINNGQPEPGDAELQVLDVLRGTIELRGAMDAAAVSALFQTQNSSFHTSTFCTVNAGSGAISTQLAQVAKGLWEFDVCGSFNSNYFNQNLYEHSIQLVFPSGLGTIYLLGFNAGGAAANPIAQTYSRKLKLLLPMDNCLIRIVGNNNLAGQNANSSWDITVNRLL